MDFNIAPTKILRVADHACCYFTAFFTRRISLRLPDGISTEHAISDILACGKQSIFCGIFNKRGLIPIYSLNAKN
jgi:hypothetical protein